MPKSSESSSAVADKEGLLEKRAGSSKKLNDNLTSGRWNKYHFKLIGGSLYYFEKAKSKQARGFVHLNKKGATVEAIKQSGKEPRDDVKNFCFVITLPKKDDCVKFVLSASSIEEAEEWVSAIKLNLDKPTVSLPVSNKDVLFNARKGVAGKVATSAVGKKLIKKVIPERQRNLIAAVKRLIEVQYEDKAVATRLEKSCIKIVLKAYFQWQNKTISTGALVALDKPIRRALTLLYKLHTGLDALVGDDEKLRKQTLEEKLCIISYLLGTVHERLAELLKPHLQEKNVKMLDELFEKVTNFDFLFGVYNNEALKDDLAIVLTEVKWYIEH